ncbi:MAG: prolyl oligopeptidase family serine peptidase [Gammaproteobacteria bacterium]|nr:prolyl oligopeptidase family serine peptidase [Gammaproteobacteria bacterium]
MSHDPHLWLEQIDDPAALAWVEQQNQQTVSRYSESVRFKELQNRFRAILDSDERIPMFNAYGQFIYNFWQTAENPKGVWRRTTLEEYQKDDPNWEILIDFDKLAKQEDKDWVYAGHEMLRPTNDRALVFLSKGGGDAIEIREFDTCEHIFVKDGFFVPEAKSKVTWAGRDRLLVGTDFGTDSLTDSGYPMTVRSWQRGTPLEASKEIFRGKRSDVFVFSMNDATNDYREMYIWRGTDFFTSKFFAYRDDQLSQINKPDSAEASVQQSWLLLRLKEEWTIANKTYDAGSLLIGKVSNNTGLDHELQVLFEPGQNRILESWSVTNETILFQISENVCSRLYLATETSTGWEIQRASTDTTMVNESGQAVDFLTSSRFLLWSESFTTPPTLSLGNTNEPPQVIKRTPSFFDTAAFETTQHWANSADGTKVPYFETKCVNSSGEQPTLLYGYGGFEISLLPTYAPNMGVGWLERGGAYIVANIRGGGEFGPNWHHAALRDKRYKAYEDFIAVAEHLIARRVTSQRQLAIQGGSNGGLLMGNMYTQRPDLFGAVVCQVPLLDMQRFHLLLAGASWMAEYGDPDNPNDWEYLKAFSPYHNVSPAKDYPPILITTSTRDDRVHPGHARKMVAKLRELGMDVTYYENTVGGHAGATDNSQRAFLLALVYEYLWQKLVPNG